MIEINIDFDEVRGFIDQFVFTQAEKVSEFLVEIADVVEEAITGLPAADEIFDIESGPLFNRDFFRNI